jgi:hypothetical protein
MIGPTPREHAVKKLLPIVVVALFAGAAYAAPSMKPGLWEMRIKKNVVDGHDTSAEMAGMNAKMNEQLARMPPEQRAKMAEMMGQRGMAMPPMAGGPAGGGVIRMCITPEMAKRDVPVADKDGGCQPTNVQRSGNRMTYELKCDRDGSKITGKGESTVEGDSILTKSDTTVQERGETHRIQSEMEMRFVGADCGNVKPLGGPPHH